MPPTRTTPLRHGSRQPLQPQHTPPNNNIAREIIVLSSDDDEPSTRKPVVKRSKPRPKQKRKQTPVAPPPPPPEVVEITSDEDSPPKDAMQELREQLEKAKREIAMLKKAACAGDGRHNLQIQRLATEAESAKSTKQKLLNALDDQICCEICTLKMWSPYTLDCGHTFCFNCLQDWFSTILAQHMNTHPEYNPTPPMHVHYQNALRNPAFPRHDRLRIQRELREFHEHIDHPNYTCPSCRVSVKSKPAEAFAVKNIVHVVAESQGEANPRKRNSGKARQEDPWEGFFPVIFSPI